MWDCTENHCCSVAYVRWGEMARYGVVVPGYAAGCTMGRDGERWGEMGRSDRASQRRARAGEMGRDGERWGDRNEHSRGGHVQERWGEIEGEGKMEPKIVKENTEWGER